MGRKSSAAGNAYRNPVENYRKQLGKNEERKSGLRPRSRGSRHKPSQKELAKSRTIPKSLKSLAVYLALFLVVMVVAYCFVMVGAGSFVYRWLTDADNSGNMHMKIHRDS